MAELRWNPLIKDWVMVASHRQGRPQMPKDWCPFCPGSGKVPEEYVVHKYDNDFPALSQNPPEPDDVATDFFKVKEAYGKCEVILYSPEHTVTLPELSVDHIEKLVDLWTERFVEISADEKIKYVFIFENRGDVVGVTMPHPHGQIYGYSVIPKKIELEMDSCKEYFTENKKCLICDMLKEEAECGSRVIIENEYFMSVLPFFTEYPYGMYIISKNHKQNLTQFTADEKRALAEILKDTTGIFDSLFDTKFPYMMCMYQNPVNGEDTSDFYHFHIAFYPPMRSADKVKFNASSETGAWAHCNPTAPEEKAVELRAAYEKFKKGSK
ncbi:MAG: galactose-1-phosphate uridylyltransferase [Clostridia bacterium]|nr:galactose-1-phosphate uridylyltransferase [Clostridia bacterium]